MNKILIGAVIVLGIGLIFTYDAYEKTRTENQELMTCHEQYLVATGYTTDALEELADAQPVIQRIINELDMYGYDIAVSNDLDNFIAYWNRANKLTIKADEASQDAKCFEVEGEAATGV